MAQTSGLARRAWIYGPLVLVLVLAAVWTVFWFYAAHRAEAAVATWLEREALSGRIHGCENRAVGGYPFRIEMRCSGPHAELRGFGSPVRVRAASLMAVAQIYQPDLVIAELVGPMTIVADAGATSYTINWRLLQASMRGFPRNFQRTSLAIEDAVVRPTGNVEPVPLAQVRHVEIHARRSPDPAQTTFDLALSSRAAILSLIPTFGAQPFDLHAAGVATGVKDFSPRPMNERLRQWQADGGRLQIARVRFARGEALALASGEMGLTPQGQIDGALSVKLAGLDQFVGIILGEGAQKRTQSLLTGLALLAGREELEGKRAIALPLRFKEGTASLGPIVLGQIAPLY